MDLMPYSQISDYNGHMFEVSLVDRYDGNEQRWGVEVRKLNAEDNSQSGETVTLKEQFTTVEAARSAGNDMAHSIAAEQFKTVG
jgi:hypothetical protein